MAENTVLSLRTDLSAALLLGEPPAAWSSAPAVQAYRIWNGDPAPSDGPPTAFTVSSLWSDDGIFFRFECGFDRLNVDPEPGLDGPIDRLWERDVVEVFLRPTGSSEYFEVEVSPLGQWVDLRIIRPRQQVDSTWRSQLARRVTLDHKSRRWLTILHLPWGPMLAAAPGTEVPRAGDSWRVNFFRAAGFSPDRLYLCWRPTLTERPDFHVPDAFGHLLFVEPHQALGKTDRIL